METDNKTVFLTDEEEKTLNPFKHRFSPRLRYDLDEFALAIPELASWSKKDAVQTLKKIGAEKIAMVKHFEKPFMNVNWQKKMQGMYDLIVDRTANNWKWLDGDIEISKKEFFALGLGLQPKDYRKQLDDLLSIGLIVFSCGEKGKRSHGNGALSKNWKVRSKFEKGSYTCGRFWLRTELLREVLPEFCFKTGEDPEVICSIELRSEKRIKRLRKNLDKINNGYLKAGAKNITLDEIEAIEKMGNNNPFKAKALDELSKRIETECSAEDGVSDIQIGYDIERKWFMEVTDKNGDRLIDEMPKIGKLGTRCYSKIHSIKSRSKAQKIAEIEGKTFVEEPGVTYREDLLLQGKPLVELWDIPHAFPTFIGWVNDELPYDSDISPDAAEIRRYRNYIQKNDIYSDILKHSRIVDEDSTEDEVTYHRFKVKGTFQAYVNMVKCHYEFRSLDKSSNDSKYWNAVIKFMSEKFPTIDKMIRNWKEETEEEIIPTWFDFKKKKVKTLIRSLQALELKVMRAICSNVNVPFITIHDAVYVKDNDSQRFDIKKFDKMMWNVLNFSVFHVKMIDVHEI